MKSNDMMVTFSTEMTELQGIEARIHAHIVGTYSNILAVGRCLNEAKDRGLVAHGEWEAWVLANTGMSVRSAQRLMQAAREVPENSAMAQLPLTKISALLAAPEGEREKLAEKAAAENLTVKQLQQQVKQLQKANADQNKKMQQMESAEQRRADLLDRLSVAKSAAEGRAKELEAKIEALLENTEDTISEKAQAEIDRLRADLAAAEEYAGQQAELRQQAQQELLNASIGNGSNSAAQSFGPAELDAAVRAFMAEAGMLPHMGAELCRMDESSRQDMRNALHRLRGWLDTAEKALCAYVIEMEG